MIASLSTLLFVIFLFLGMIHFNWVFGGKWGIEKALPTNEEGERVLNPKKLDSAIVGFGLILFSWFYFLKTGLITFQLTTWISSLGDWIIPLIFLLRAIGDFKYIGFFKKIKNTEFGKADTLFFSPLCLFLTFVGINIALFQYI